MAAVITPRDRVRLALAFQETDIVPYHLMIDGMVRSTLAQYLGDAEFERQIDNHLPFYNLEPKETRLSPSDYRDAFGCIWRAGHFPHLEHPPLQYPSLEGYQFPDLLHPDYFKGVKDFFEHHPQHFTLCGIAHGFFDRGWALRGMENFLMDFITSPIFVQELFENLTSIYIQLIDHIATYPFDGIRFGDDWGYQRGLITGLKRWRKFIKPGLQKIFAHARELGLTVMVHSDGDVTELIPDLIDMGVQILNPLQPEAMDVLEVKRCYGRDICLNGGISTQFTLPRGTEQDVRREVKACLRCLGKGGGYVISPAKAILPDVPLANAAALIDGLVNQKEIIHSKGEGGNTGDQAEALRRVYAEFHPRLI